MKFEELIAELDVRKVAIEPEPINSDFVSLGELLLRLQTTPAKPLTLTQAAHILLSLGFRTGGAPEWKCNGKLGIVPIEAFNYEWAVKRLEYVFHSNRFESDGNGASTDYELFGFDRKEFADFLALKVGEPLDLFCPMPEPQDATPRPAPVVAAKRSEKKPSIQTVALDYMRAEFKQGQFQSAAKFHKHLIKTAGLDKSPFEMGTGINARNLFCPAASSFFDQGTLGKIWAKIRAV